MRIGAKSVVALIERLEILVHLEAGLGVDRLGVRDPVMARRGRFAFRRTGPARLEPLPIDRRDTHFLAVGHD